MKFTLTGDGTVERTEPWPKEADWLKLSIQKLQFVVDCVEAGRGVYGCGGPDTCGLCHRGYMLSGDCSPCNGCVIAQHTGEGACLGTPYEKWVWLLEAGDPMTIEVAREWLEFLEELHEVQAD